MLIMSLTEEADVSALYRGLYYNNNSQFKEFLSFIRLLSHISYGEKFDKVKYWRTQFLLSIPRKSQQQKDWGKNKIF